MGIRKLVSSMKKKISRKNDESDDGFYITEDKNGNLVDGGPVKNKNIVVSLKKLKEYISKKSGGLFDELKGIVKKTNINEAKNSIVDFVTNHSDDLEETDHIIEKVLIFSLISFYFRKEKPREETEVKFSKKDSNLLTKINNWIHGKYKGENDKDECKKAMDKILGSVIEIIKTDWGRTGDLITSIKADKSVRARRMLSKTKLEIRETAHNVKKQIYGSNDLSPKAIKQFESFKTSFNADLYLENCKFNDVRFIEDLKEYLTQGDFKDSDGNSVFENVSNFKDLKENDLLKKFPEKFRTEWEKFIENVEKYAEMAEV